MTISSGLTILRVCKNIKICPGVYDIIHPGIKIQSKYSVLRGKN